eukprot:3797229-Pyramimonas_sp.AAC.1
MGGERFPRLGIGGDAHLPAPAVAVGVPALERPDGVHLLLNPVKQQLHFLRPDLRHELGQLGVQVLDEHVLIPSLTARLHQVHGLSQGLVRAEGATALGHVLVVLDALDYITP